MGVSVLDNEPAGEGTERLTFDECFDLLSNHRRRYTLYYLEQNGEAATIGDLSARIAAWENDILVSDVTYDERKRVYTSLQQVHLPRMDEADVIEFDDRSGAVELGPAAADLDIYLDVVMGHDIPWSHLYVGLAGVNVLVVAAFALGSVPALSGLGVAVFVATSYLLTSLAHLYITHTEMRIDRDLPE